VSVMSINSVPVPRRIGTWILRGVVATTFFAAGAAKLAGAAYMVELFDQIGATSGFATSQTSSKSRCAGADCPGTSSGSAAFGSPPLFFGLPAHVFCAAQIR